MVWTHSWAELDLVNQWISVSVGEGVSFTDAGVMSAVALKTLTWGLAVMTDVTLPDTIETTTIYSEDLPLHDDARDRSTIG